MATEAEKIGHTPGPWRAVKAKHGPIDILDGRERDVVTVYGGGVETESREANARLIAAAPDLLEALKHARNQIQHPDQMIDEAISKAEERS